jgi:HK97 family phage major capsid protein
LATLHQKALAVARGNVIDAIALAQSQGYPAAVIGALKAAVGAMDTDEAAALLAPVGLDYAEFLRPQTIIGRLAGMRRVPFQVRMVAQSAGTSAHWVGEKNPKPATRAEFAGETLPVAKVASIAVITDELARSSEPSAEVAIGTDMRAAGAQALDFAFIDPANAGISGIKPASITFGAPSFPSSGASVANIDDDLSLLIETLSNAGSDLTFAAWVMRPRTAIYLSRLRGTSDGPPAYPFITAKGGTLMGIPVLTSANVPAGSGTGNPASITLLDAAQISIADDGDSALSIATHASIQMESEPETGGVATEQVSLWQHGLVGLRAERMVNWKRRHANTAAVLTGVTF